MEVITPLLKSSIWSHLRTFLVNGLNLKNQFFAKKQQTCVDGFTWKRFNRLRFCRQWILMSSCDWFEAKLTLMRLKDTLIGTAALPVSVNTDVKCQSQAREGICMRIFFPTSFSTHFKTLVKVFFPHRPRTWSLPSREINVRSKVRDPTWNSLISPATAAMALLWYERYFWSLYETAVLRSIVCPECVTFFA